MDIGDIVGVKGFVFRTNMGEVSVHAKELVMLSKSLRPLPVVKEKDGKVFDAFTDPELRYRQRYLDLIVNPQVKDVFIKRTKMINAIRQFYSETNWGEIDYLFVDMPPGTSDVLLTVFQSLPVDGIVTVSAPQELVAMIVGKAVNLAHDMNVELLGLVENMAYFECPDCGKRHHIFGDPQGAAVAERYDIPAYATLPIDPSFARLCDAGKVEDYDVAGALDPIIAQIEAAKQD